MDSESAPALPEDGAMDRQLATQVLALQAQELEQRKAELGVRAQEIEQAERDNQRAHDYAIKALGVRERETERHVKLFTSVTAYRYGLGALIVLLLSGLAFMALHLGAPELVEKAMTHLVALGGGAGLGYAWKAKQEKQREAEADED